MPVESPFHPRTQALCHSYRWKDWAGFYAVCRFDHCQEREYFAFRQACGLIDVTPLYKYEVRGRDACRLLCRMMVKDIAKLRVGQVTYCCWCDDRGKVVDDGTVSRLGEDHYRVTAADPTYHWLERLAHGLAVTVHDSTAELAVLALQGPTARQALEACSDVRALRYFRVTRARIGELQGWVSRTGYTGDLGYEIWVDRRDALRLWDTLCAEGRPFGLTPAGLDALDMTRIEAGFILLGVDYFSAPKVMLESRKSSPYELGLGWAVNLERDPFVGQVALAMEMQRGSPWQLCGIEASWEGLEALYERFGLPPALSAEACRSALPVYAGRRQVGQVTSHVWSPLLKKKIGIASIRPGVDDDGLTLEHTVEYERAQVPCKLVPLPFFDPPRKKA
jgi:aminomethyltransferase